MYINALYFDYDPDIDNNGDSEGGPNVMLQKTQAAADVSLHS